MLICKMHISSSRDPNELVRILLGFLRTLVFIENRKHAMFCYEKWGYYLYLLFMHEKRKIISLCR
jgi:hypothetical protein